MTLDKEKDLLDFAPTNLPEVLNIFPKAYHDKRGFFLETYSAMKYKEIGIKEDFVQDNFSRSDHGILRGLHYQINHPQGKLVRVVRGEVFDVAVDIRIGSPRFGKASWSILSSEQKNQLWIPPGFAHGFCVISKLADLEYKCTDFYYPEDEGTLLWNDPNLEIDWPIDFPKLSPKDEAALPLSEIPRDQLPIYEV